MGSFSIWHWLVVLLIVVLVFGTRNCAISVKIWAARSKASRKA